MKSMSLNPVLVLVFIKVVSHFAAVVAQGRKSNIKLERQNAENRHVKL